MCASLNSLDGTITLSQYQALGRALTTKEVCLPGISLVQIWADGWPEKVSALAKANQLIPLVMSYVPALDEAANLRLDHPHLSMHEILELAGLPLELSGTAAVDALL